MPTNKLDIAKQHLQAAITGIKEHYGNLDQSNSDDSIRERACCISVAFYLRGALKVLGDDQGGDLFLI